MTNKRVIFLPSTFVDKTSEWNKYGKLDGYATSHEMQALITKQEREGYEMVSMTPLPGKINAALT